MEIQIVSFQSYRLTRKERKYRVEAPCSLVIVKYMHYDCAYHTT